MPHYDDKAQREIDEIIDSTWKDDFTKRPKRFRNRPKALQKLLDMYKSKEYTLKQIAKRFKIDHTSVVYQVQKAGLSKGSTYGKYKKKGYPTTRTVVKKNHCSVCSIISKTKVCDYCKKI